MSATKRRKNDATTGTVPVLMLTVDQAAEALQLNYSTTIRLCRRGELAAVKRGKEWRIPMLEIQAHIADLMKKSAAVRAAKWGLAA